VATRQSAVGNGVTDYYGVYDAVVQADVDPGVYGTEAGKTTACSGTLVTPFYVLTANHCVTGTFREGLACTIAKSPPIADLSLGATVKFFLPTGNGYYPLTPSKTVYHTAATAGDFLVRNTSPVNFCNGDEIEKDIALIRLDQRVSTDLVAPVHPPILGLDSLTFSPDCLAGLDPGDFTATVVGYGNDNIGIGFPSGNDARVRQEFTSSGWNQDGGLFRNDWLVTSSYYGTLPGDSGGALFSSLGRLCGVNSAWGPEADPAPRWYTKHVDLQSSGSQAFLQDHILDKSKTHFVGQCNANDPRPWTDAKLDNTDVDKDGMPDGCDPCPFDPYSDPQGDFDRDDYGANGETDGDQDGVPDACDNCPPRLCDLRGLPRSECANPYPAKFGPQADADGDGVGDVCDSCPMTKNASSNYAPSVVDDRDNDGVGAACDDCDRRNPVKPCKTDADCKYSSGDKNGFCIDIGSYGKCDDADGWACYAIQGSAGCRSNVSCVETGSYGRCSQQLDDVNQNGIGGECDSCDSVQGNTILANSNDIRESLEGLKGAEVLGDECDPVPLYSARMVLAPDVLPGIGGTTHPFDLFDPTKRTWFTATAGVGNDPAKGGAIPPALSLTTGFRWCNCHDPVLGDIPLDECIKRNGGCTKNPTSGYNPKPNEQTTWFHVTTQTYPSVPGVPLTPNSFSTPGTLDHTVSPTFTTSTSLDFLNHPYGPKETQRVGEPQDLLWDQDADIAAGRVQTFYVTGKTDPQTTGAFWSHVEDNGVDYASQRDHDYYDGAKGLSNGGLRDNYAYVKTPAVQHVFAPSLNKCAGGPCYPQWSADLLVSPAEAVISPSLVATSPAEGLLTCSGGCSVVGPTATADVTNAIVSPLDQYIQDPDLVFLPAVERGYQVLHTGTATPGVMSVMMPRDWSTGTTPTRVVFDGRTLGLESFIDRRALTSSSAQIAPVGPGSRSAPAYALTLKQSAVYMVGGTLSSGEQAREIWRYDLVGRTWDELVSPLGGTLDDPAPFDVLAASYDPSQNQLAYIDQTVAPDDDDGDDDGDKKNGGNPGWHGYRHARHHRDKRRTPVARLVVVNTAPLESSVSLVLPRTGTLGSVYLTARGDGTWVLTGQLRYSHAWVAYDFALDEAGHLTWNGWRVGQGVIVQQPLNSGDGVFLPVNRRGSTRFVRLEPDDFKQSGGKWDTL